MNLTGTAEWAMAQTKIWSERVQDRRSVEIKPGSALDTDPSLPGGATLALLAWRALGTAGEHAGMAHVVTSSTENGVLAKPFMTAGRTAMLGAAKAVFVLLPDSSNERRVRALQVLRTEAKDVVSLVSTMEKAMSLRSVEAARKAADGFLAECERELVKTGKKPGSQVSETAILESVSGVLDMNDPRLAVMTAWNTMSGTAHARMWTWDSGFEDRPIIEQYLLAWSVPLGLLDHAWSLWNLRRGKI